MQAVHNMTKVVQDRGEMMFRWRQNVTTRKVAKQLYKQQCQFCSERGDLGGEQRERGTFRKKQKVGFVAFMKYTVTWKK